jgi:hypothetical protein
MADTAVRDRRRVARLGAAFLVGVLVAGCSGGGAGDVATVEVDDVEITMPPSPQEVLRAAATTTASAESGRTSVSMAVDGDLYGTPIHATVQGQGRFAAFGAQSEINLDMTTYMRQAYDAAGAHPFEIPSAFEIHTIVVDATGYLNVQTDPISADHDVWYSIDLTTDAAGLAISGDNLVTPGGFGASPIVLVESLRGVQAGAVASGSDRVGGVRADRYEGVIDPSAALDAVDPAKRSSLEQAFVMAGIDEPVPFTVWVGDDGVVRRIRYETRTDLGTVGALDIAYTVELDDLGGSTPITPPAQNVEPLPYGEGFEAGDGDATASA